MTTQPSIEKANTLTTAPATTIVAAPPVTTTDAVNTTIIDSIIEFFKSIGVSISNGFDSTCTAFTNIPTGLSQFWTGLVELDGTKIGSALSDNLFSFILFLAILIVLITLITLLSIFVIYPQVKKALLVRKQNKALEASAKLEGETLQEGEITTVEKETTITEETSIEKVKETPVFEKEIVTISEPVNIMNASEAYKLVTDEELRRLGLNYNKKKTSGLEFLFSNK
ncbi:hypothetical protein NEFER03_1860 [Nematocida sp. LUAm3]|nr:hypothetical protein NEFER03_1860 [Nematocida sp. LUAm3]KAI5173990.1 hypothetical protein NEFER02_0457 [Nematocida sp. LUAm2]KAI5177266.1 hypothetical protein NEFER01_0541 [Nematocida sp. LUAm1]